MRNVKKNANYRVENEVTFPFIRFEENRIKYRTYRSTQIITIQQINRLNRFIRFIIENFVTRLTVHEYICFFYLKIYNLHIGR